VGCGPARWVPGRPARPRAGYQDDVFRIVGREGQAERHRLPRVAEPGRRGVDLQPCPRADGAREFRCCTPDQANESCRRAKFALGRAVPSSP
jgi:hypothetical protein